MPRWTVLVVPLLLALLCLQLSGCLLVPIDHNRGQWRDRDGRPDRWSDRDGRYDRDHRDEYRR
jgi:hypothetical protein